MAGTRYVRYIVFAFACLIIIFFISSSSSGPVQAKEQLKNASDKLKDKFKNEKAKGEDAFNNHVPTEPVPDLGDIAHHLPDGHPEKPIDSSHSTSGNTVHGEIPGKDTTPNTKDPLRGSVPGPRMNATFVSLARNGDVWEIAESIRQMEDRFNHKYNYDWVFLNDKPFDDDFKRITTNLVSGTTKYGLISEEHWSFPEWIDQDKAAQVRQTMGEKKIIYGDSVSYRHMCRFESGFFFEQPLMLEYEWYWRVEPSVKFFCDLDYDAFKFMSDNNKKYSFVLSLYEYVETIPTLWDSVKKFMHEKSEYIVKGNSMNFISDDGGYSYNHCHFWSNFEIGNLNWLRSQAYREFFNHLDHEGGFFYERWGDAPVHSIAAALLLPKEEIHFFNDIGYYHVPFTHCPNTHALHDDGKCRCNPGDNFDWNGYSCLNKFYDIHGMSKPSHSDRG